MPLVILMIFVYIISWVFTFLLVTIPSYLEGLLKPPLWLFVTVGLLFLGWCFQE